MRGYLDGETRARAPDADKLALGVVDDHSLEVSSKNCSTSGLGSI